MSQTVRGAKGHNKLAATERKTTDQHDRMSAEHHEKVAVAAYFHAEHRGFNGGDSVADWLAAETEIVTARNKGEDASVH